VNLTVYCLWALFALFALPYLRRLRRTRGLRGVTFFYGHRALLAFWFLDYFLGALSPTRIYAVASILIKEVLSSAAISLTNISIGRARRTSWKLAVKFLIALLVVVSVASLPSYLIENTTMVRPPAPIDKVHYWSADLPQHSLCTFLETSTFNKRIHPHMLIENYEFLEAIHSNNLAGIKSTDFKGGFEGSLSKAPISSFSMTDS